MRQVKYEYDAFISHAVEDKIPIANELCAKLEKAGLRIWYSGKELGIGDSIEKTIEKGLNRSRYGIVIFSPTYLAKNWTIREFYTLLAKEIEQQKVILPVLYNISLDELKNKDLLMADRFAVNADRGIDFVVERLVREIRKPEVSTPKLAWFSRIWFVLILSLLANVAFLLNGIAPRPSPAADGEATLVPPIAARPAQAGLLGEMQSLLEEVNGCSCSQPGVDEESKVKKSVLTRSRPAKQLAHEDGNSAGIQEKSAQTNGRGKKMTMAVVIQIETPPHSEPDVEKQVTEMLETLETPQEEADPFITASNRDQTLIAVRPACARSHHARE